MAQNNMSPIGPMIFYTKVKQIVRDFSPYANWLYALFGYHSYQYANELKLTNLSLFSISNNC